MSGDREDVFPSVECADRLKALGDPLRLRIVSLLYHGEKSVSQIAEALDTELMTVSHHLQILKNANLLANRRDGRFIIYSLENGLRGPETSSKQCLNLGCCSIVVR